MKRFLSFLSSLFNARQHFTRESEAPFANGGGADEFSLFHNSEIDRG